MVQLFDFGPTEGNILGQALGQGLARYQQQQQQTQQQGQLAKGLFGENWQQYANLPMEAQLKAAQFQQSEVDGIQKLISKQQEQQEKLGKEQEESKILAKHQRGEELTSDETANLSPTSLRTLIGQEKPMFEPREQALEAERVSKLASEIETDYQGVSLEEKRLGRMENLSDKDQLTTPLMKKVLDTFGLPLGILNNPDSEEFAKLEADFLRDVRSIFPGRVTNFEVQAYMRGIPTLSNTKKGRKSIIRNRRLMNDAKKVRYDVYREIIKENKGVKPRNLGLQIEDRSRERLDNISEEFRSGITEEIEKFQQPLRMKDSEGSFYDIPTGKVEEAIKMGLSF
jgi:hypothetical protein